MRVIGALVLLAVVGGQDAIAACPPQTVGQAADRAKVIFVGVAQSGPVTPARFTVERWEKGRGGRTVDVSTGITADTAFGDAIRPHAGERWRIYGELVRGQVETGACDGSHRLAGRPSGPWLGLDASHVQLVATTFDGMPKGKPLPVMTLHTGRPLRLRLSAKAPDIRLFGAPRKARLTRRHGVWMLTLPASVRHAGKLVVDTGDGFFAARLAVTGASRRRAQRPR